MKISKVSKHGKPRWLVNDASGQGGKRQRKFFATKEEAETYARERTTEKKEYGLHFGSIPPKERAALMYQLQRLHSLGWTLGAAVDFVEKNGKQANKPEVPLGTVADEFLAAKETAGLRPRYVKTLRASIHRFLLNRRQRLISEVTPAEIQEYISSNGWLPATMRSYLVDVRTLFAFAVKRKYVTENPALAVDLPRTEENPPGILTPKQTIAVLDACLDHAPDILPSIFTATERLVGNVAHRGRHASRPELRRQAQAGSGKGQAPRRMVAKCPAPFIRQLPFREVQKRERNCRAHGQLAANGFPALPRTCSARRCGCVL